MNNQSITLSDGRALGFACLGAQDGRPLFFFHGTPGSRFVLTEDDLISQLPGTRIIIPERPGYGISDPKPGRTILDWPDDVVELADFLGLNSFAVSGMSGGGPHALACASRFPNRISKVLLFSSPAPVRFKGATRGMALGNRLSILISRFAPGLIGWMIRSAATEFKKNPERSLVAVGNQLSPADQEEIEDEACLEAAVRNMLEGYRQGGDAHAQEAPLVLTSRDWGFDLRKISVPVHLWHGEEDTLAPAQMARYLEREIPGCRAYYVPGAGHLLIDRPEVIEKVREVLCTVEP